MTPLLKPINTKWLNSSYFAFVETYDWKSGVDYQSPKVAVAPGARVFAQVARKSAGQFVMSVLASGVWTNFTATVPSYVAPLVMAYVVLEHQPQSCAMFPADQQFVFHDLLVRPAGTPWM